MKAEAKLRKDLVRSLARLVHVLTPPPDLFCQHCGSCGSSGTSTGGRCILSPLWTRMLQVISPRAINPARSYLATSP